MCDQVERRHCPHVAQTLVVECVDGRKMMIDLLMNVYALYMDFHSLHELLWDCKMNGMIYPLLVSLLVSVRV
jgi:hypothetical protein